MHIFSFGCLLRYYTERLIYPNRAIFSVASVVECYFQKTVFDPSIRRYYSTARTKGVQLKFDNRKSTNKSNEYKLESPWH